MLNSEIVSGAVPYAAIVQPLFAMFLLTAVVWVYMYARRIPFINTLDLPSNELTPATLARLSPPGVSNPSDNLQNLFELPVVFYAVVLYLHVTGLADAVDVAAAWVFVGFRVLHSAVHCTANIVVLRFGLYAIASVSLWFMVVRAAWPVLLG